MVVEQGIKDYKVLLKRKDALEKERNRLGRERDLKVNLLNEKYQNKIDNVVLSLDYIDGAIKNAKEFVRRNGGKNND